MKFEKLQNNVYGTKVNFATTYPTRIMTIAADGTKTEDAKDTVTQEQKSAELF